MGGWVSCFPLFFFLRGWVGGGCVVLSFFFFAFSVLVAVAGWCCGCPRLPVVVWWLLSRGVVGCVVWLVVLLRCLAAPLFVVFARVVVVPGARRFAVVACRFAAVAVAGVVGPVLLLLLAAAAFLLAMTFLPAPAKLRPHFRSACHRSPTYDNIVLTLPVSAPISAFGPSASSVLSCSGHGTALRTHHLPLVARRYGVFFFCCCSILSSSYCPTTQSHQFAPLSSRPPRFPSVKSLGCFALPVYTTASSRTRIVNVPPFTFIFFSLTLLRTPRPGVRASSLVRATWLAHTRHQFPLHLRLLPWLGAF